MLNEKDHIKGQLNIELQDVSFSKTQQVLKRTHPETFSAKLTNWLEKEITIPLVPIAVSAFILVSVSIVPTVFENGKVVLDERHIVEIGGNYYWNDLLREGNRHEGYDQK